MWKFAFCVDSLRRPHDVKLEETAFLFVNGPTDRIAEVLAEWGGGVFSRGGIVGGRPYATFERAVGGGVVHFDSKRAVDAAAREGGLSLSLGATSLVWRTFFLARI
jgi:hypothetical protein